MTGADGLLLAAKILTAATIVVAASRATERAGPRIGALIATLPVSAGPVYVFLALDHGVAFIADSSRMSVAGTAATGVFIAAHAFAARRFRTAGSLALATIAWLLAALAIQARDWGIAEACLLSAVVFGGAIRGLRRFATSAPAARPPRNRFDLAVRAGLVALVVVVTTVAGNTLGPAVTGVLATYPVVFTSLVVILQPACGGPFASSVLVQGLKGMLGFLLALVALHFAASNMGAAPALLIALAVSVGWNLALFLRR